MRCQIALFLLVFGFVKGVLAVEQFPYKARVRNESEQLRSGPGKNFYATDNLQQGDEVDVYRHDPGGWCAVRPPESGFSWVRARNLDIDEEEGFATVNADEVVARIGSSLTEARDVIQVHLERGERVELVDGDQEQPGSWRKIAPPAGEFRWLPLTSLEKLDAGSDDDDPLAAAEKRVAAESEAAENAADVEPEDYVLVQFTEPNDLSPPIEPVLAPAGEAALPETPPMGRRVRRLSHTALQQEIVDIDLELSTRAAEDEARWVFDDLRERAERAAEMSPTALDKAQVNELLGKIDRFENLRDRHDDSRLAQAKLPGSRLTSNGEPGMQAIVDTSRFDGVGRLAPVISKQSGAPQYALVDSTGTVRYYLQAAPGMNLRQFVNKQIGVNGTRGRLADKQQQVISAQRITELPATTRRF